MSRRSVLGWILGGVAVLSVGSGGGIYFYLRNRTPDQALHVLRGHSDTVTNISWSPDGTQLASSSRDSTVRLWSVTNEQSSLTYSGHQASVLTVVWRFDGRVLASGGEDQTVKIWDTSGITLHSFPNQGATVSSIVWGPNGETLIAGTLGDGGHEISTNRGTLVKSVFKATIHALAFSPDRVRLAAALDDGSVTVLINLEEPARRKLYHKHSGAALALAWSPDGAMLASGGSDNVAYVWDAATGRNIQLLQHEAAVNGVAWEPGNIGRVATASSDNKVSIWDVNSSTRTIYDGHWGAVTSVAWSSGGLASGSEDRTVIVWKI